MTNHENIQLASLSLSHTQTTHKHTHIHTHTKKTTTTTRSKHVYTTTPLSDLASVGASFSCLSSHHHHQSLNREGRWGTTTSFLHFPLFSTTVWDLANCRPVHSLMLSFYLFLCLPCLLLPLTVPCKMVLIRPNERET